MNNLLDLCIKLGNRISEILLKAKHKYLVSAKVVKQRYWRDLVTNGARCLSLHYIGIGFWMSDLVTNEDMQKHALYWNGLLGPARFLCWYVIAWDRGSSIHLNSPSFTRLLGTAK
ncbi:hypothetical protein L1049_001522 [Liquidambar formosana]|uniref:Uncharacterized protein n=1 Tax=Liquidambar formosana TaxID=63359 RepID=A0AAP0R697_LIQFO